MTWGLGGVSFRRIEIEEIDDVMCVATIEGNSFLWHMIRMIMGVLFMIGHKFEPVPKRPNNQAITTLNSRLIWSFPTLPPDLTSSGAVRYRAHAGPARLSDGLRDRPRPLQLRTRARVPDPAR